MRRRQEKQKGRPGATGTALPRAAATACGPARYPSPAPWADEARPGRNHPAFPPAPDTSGARSTAAEAEAAASHSFVQPCFRHLPFRAGCPKSRNGRAVSPKHGRKKGQRGHSGGE